MKNFLALFTVLFGVSAFANPLISQVPTSTFEYQINRFLGSAAFVQLLGTKVRQAHNTAVGVYDFAVVGGAIGELPVPITFPDKALIRRCFYDVITAPTSGGSATIAFRAQSAGDLRVALAVASWAVGRIEGVPDGAIANMIKLTAARSVTATVAVAALTAGKIRVFCDYVLSE